jgi:hypothetical protein
MYRVYDICCEASYGVAGLLNDLQRTKPGLW